MTRRLGILVGTALLAVATACAEPQSAPEQAPVPPAQSAPAAEPEDQSGRTPPAGSDPVPAAQVVAEALPEGYPVTVWTADDGTTVGAVAQEGGCGKASAEVAQQSGEQVVITLVETTPKKAEMCTMDIRYQKLTVELDQPLGDREVVLKSEQRQS